MNKHSALISFFLFSSQPRSPRERKKKRTNVIKRLERQKLERHPHRAPPIILPRPKRLVVFTETPDAVRRPELLRVSQQVEHRSELGRVWGQETEEEREKRDVAGVADWDRVICLWGRGMSVLERERGKVEKDGPSSSTVTSQYISSSSLQCKAIKKELMSDQKKQREKVSGMC